MSDNEELLTTLDLLQQIVEHQQDKILVNWVKMGCIETAVKCASVRHLLHLLQARMDECYKGDKKFTRACIDAFENEEGDDGILTRMKEITRGVFEGTKEQSFKKMWYLSRQPQSSATADEKAFNKVSRLVCKNLQFSSSISSVYLEQCDLSAPMFRHIAQQLQDCNKLQNLHLYKTLNIPKELCTTIRSLTSLQDVHICHVGGRISKLLMEGLSHCLRLQDLDLHGGTLTDCLQYLFGNRDHPRSSSLKRLNLSDTALAASDINALSIAVHSGKLRCLEMLDVSYNTLTDCMNNLLKGRNSFGFQSLRQLNIKNVQLSPADVRCLLTVVLDGSMPELTDMKFIPTTLTGCLGQLLSASEHDTFPFKGHLRVYKSGLNTEDMKSISSIAPKDKNLHCLRRLHLSENKLTDCLGDLMGKPDDPGFEYLRKLTLKNARLSHADLTNLSLAFRSGKLPRLNDLNLSSNTLTNSLADQVTL